MPSVAPLPAVCTVPEFSEIARISTSTTRRLIASGRLPHTKLGESPKCAVRIPTIAGLEAIGLGSVASKD